MVWYGLVQFGMVWHGLVWYGMVWYALVWFGLVLLVQFGMGGGSDVFIHEEISIMDYNGLSRTIIEGYMK